MYVFRTLVTTEDEDEVIDIDALTPNVEVCEVVEVTEPSERVFVVVVSVVTARDVVDDLVMSEEESDAVANVDTVLPEEIVDAVA
jgi:hypothetical protein